MSLTSPRPKAQAHAPRPTGYIRTITRSDGDVFYAKLKLPDGTQPQRRLGRVWTRRTRPPEGFLTRRMAEARLHAILAGEDPIVNVAPSHTTFEQACAEHLRYVRVDRQRKRSTVSDYRSVHEQHLLPFFGRDTPVEDIGTQRVEEFREHLLGRELSRRTAQKVLVILNAVMARAKRKGWIAANPCDDAEKVDVKPSDDFNVLAIDQVHAIARAAPSELVRAIILTAAFTGLRMGELLALRWRHIDIPNRIVHVQRNFVEGVEDTPKSHRRRSVPLADQAIAALEQLRRREHFTGSDALVFGSVVGEHANDDEIRDAFYAALDAAGLGHLRSKDDPIVFHDLRHTMGTMCAASGIDLRKIQAWMGHADIHTTMRYLHYVPQHDDAARLTAAFSPDARAPGVHPTGKKRGKSA